MKKRKIMYTVFFIFLITITCIIVDINRKGIKNKREKVLSAENNSITEAPGIISEEQQHNYYFKAMKNEQEEINYVKENGKFTEDSRHPYHYVYKINGMKVTKKEYKKYVDALKKEKAITASKLKWRQ